MGKCVSAAGLDNSPLGPPGPFSTLPYSPKRRAGDLYGMHINGLPEPLASDEIYWR